MGVHVVCKIFRIHQLFGREARASTLCSFPLQNMDHMLLNLGRCVYVCWGGGVERGAEEKKKESGEGRREIEGEGKQGRWGGGKERVRGRKSEVLSTHSRLKGKLNQAKNKGKGTT